MPLDEKKTRKAARLGYPRVRKLQGLLKVAMKTPLKTPPGRILMQNP
jgi:hypothetical protein